MKLTRFLSGILFVFAISMGIVQTGIAKTTLGSFIVPNGTNGQNGADGCDIQLQTATSNTPGCTTLKWIKSFKSDGTCQAKNTGDAWGSLEVCNGDDGVSPTPVCPSILKTTAEANGCVKVQRQKQAWSTSSSKCVDTSDAAEEVGDICGSVGPQGPSACDADDATNTTVDTIVRSYHRPTKANTGDKYYATYGGIDETVTYCKDGGTSPNFIQDSCNPLTRTAASQISATGTGTCAGTVLECSTSLADTGSGGMGNAGTKYYVCGDICAKTAAAYTPPELASESDSNCLNSGKCATKPGTTVTTEYNGCKSSDVVKHVDKEDTCVDPEVKSCSTSVSSSGVCTYYTCTVGDSTGKVSSTISATTYTLRKPLTDNNSVFKIASDAKAKATSNELALASKAETSALSSYVTSQAADAKYATQTALDAKLNTADLSTALTKTMITNKLGTNTYGSYSDVSDLKETVGNSSSGLVADVASNTSALANKLSKSELGSALKESGLKNDLKTAVTGSGALSDYATTAALAAKLDTTALGSTLTKTMITNKLGTDTYGSASDVSALKTTVGNSSSGLVKDVADNTSALSSKMNTSDFTKAAITNKLGTNTYGSASDVSALKTTVGNSSSGLVKDVADASAAASAADSKATAAQNTANSKIGQSDLNTALYGTGTSSNPASGSIAYKANNAATTTSVNTALYGSGGTASSPASGSIAAKANLGGSALQPSALYGTGSASNPERGSIADKASNAVTTTTMNTALYGSDGTASRPASGSIAAQASAALPAASFNTRANSWLANTAQITVESGSSDRAVTKSLLEFVVGLADVVKSSGACGDVPTGSSAAAFCNSIPADPLPAQD